MVGESFRSTKRTFSENTDGKKMPQDAFALKHIAAELDELLSGAKINKASQPDKDDVYLLTYSAKLGSKTLVLSANAENCRVSFASKEKPNPKVAPNFCMLLRKHLLGATIERIKTIEFERIVAITFSNKNDFKERVDKVLYAEIMGKYSNLILTENGIILGCLKNAPLDATTSRVMLSGAPYKLPKPQDKVELTDKQASISRLSAFLGEELGDFIFKNFKGFSFPTANEAALFARGETDAEKIYEKIVEFYFNPPLRPNVGGQGKLKDVYLTDYKSVEGEKKFYPLLSDAVDDFYTARDSAKEFQTKQKRLLDKVNAALKKNAKKLQAESDKLLEIADRETLRLKGELLTAYAYKVKNGEGAIELENYYDDNKPVKISLDKNLSANQNAQKYFKKYAKQKRAFEIVSPQKEETEKELSYLKTVALEINSAETIADFAEIEEELVEVGMFPAPKFKKKPEKETPYAVYSVDGYVVKRGKNNAQNDRLTGRAFKDDLWLHAKGYPSSHVVVETKGEQIPDNVVKIAAEICAYYSDCRGASKAPIDYTFKKYVKKPPKAKSGSVIYTDYKTALVTPNPHDELKA